MSRLYLCVIWKLQAYMLPPSFCLWGKEQFYFMFHFRTSQEMPWHLNWPILPYSSQNFQVQILVYVKIYQDCLTCGHALVYGTPSKKGDSVIASQVVWTDSLFPNLSIKECLIGSFPNLHMQILSLFIIDHDVAQLLANHS